MGTTHVFSHSIKNPASRALSEIGDLGLMMKTFEDVSGLKVSSLDSVVYELTATKIFFHLFPRQYWQLDEKHDRLISQVLGQVICPRHLLDTFSPQSGNLGTDVVWA